MLEVEQSIHQNLWKRVLIRCAILAFTALFLTLAVPKLIHLLLPFLIALLVAKLLHPLVDVDVGGVDRRISQGQKGDRLSFL